MNMRIADHPLLTFKKGREVLFTFNGRRMFGFEGEPIAVALLGSGVKVLGHSIAHHRPRGFFCANGKCSSCLMRVNGKPNVRVCEERLTEGARIETQNLKGVTVESS
jgi:predicted molibdopterin-dependent oxidoreductase YjgC